MKPGANSPWRQGPCLNTKKARESYKAYQQRGSNKGADMRKDDLSEATKEALALADECGIYKPLVDAIGMLSACHAIELFYKTAPQYPMMKAVERGEIAAASEGDSGSTEVHWKDTKSLAYSFINGGKRG